MIEVSVTSVVKTKNRIHLEFSDGTGRAIKARDFDRFARSLQDGGNTKDARGVACLELYRRIKTATTIDEAVTAMQVAIDKRVRFDGQADTSGETFKDVSQGGRGQ